MKTSRTKKKLSRRAKICLLVIVLIFVCSISWLVFTYLLPARHHYSANFDCGDGRVPQSEIESFIVAHQTGGRASLKILAVDGMTAMDFRATCHSLVTDHKKLYNSQYSYADASPISPITTSTCSLEIEDVQTSIVHCGPNNTFELKSQ